jgi:calcineurin-like phosphoesterase family protein
MSKKWIISDLHFGHKNILKYSGPLRGGTTSEEHDDWLIHQINSVVKKCDLLYILGDVAFNTEHLKKVKRIKGQKILIRGNHDVQAAQYYLEYFSQIQGLLSFKGVFWMSHAPIHPQELRGRLNIHGHVHQNSILNEQGQPDERYINACVEMTYGVPQDLDALLEKWRPIVQANRAAIKAGEDL